MHSLHKNENIMKNIEKAWEQRYLETDKAIDIAKDFVKKEQDNEIKIFARLVIAYCKFLKTEYDNLFQEVTEIFEFYKSENTNHKGFIISQYLLARIYDHIGDYENAVKYATDAVESAEKIEEEEELSNACVSLGMVYNRINEYEKALELFKRGYELRLKGEQFHAAASSLNLIARTYSLLKKSYEAVKYYTESLDLREKINDTKGIPWTYMGIASLYENEKQYNEAVNNYTKALKLNKDNFDQQCDLQSHHGLGRVYLKIQKFDKSYEHLKSAKQIGDKINSKPLLYPILSSLSKYYEAKDDYKKSLEYFRQYHDLKEEVINLESLNRINNIRIEYDIRQSKQEAEIFKLRNVELKEAYKNIEEKNKDLLDSIKYAYRIQNAISPPQNLVDELIPDSFILYKPKDVVSGDFYFVSKFHDRAIFAAVDCTGHGVPGALMSVIGYNWLVQGVREGEIDTPGKLLSYLDEGVNETLRQTADESGVKDSMDLAVCTIDYKTNTVMYAGAYNPLYYVHKGELHEIKSDKLPIGVNEDGVVDIYTDHTIKLDKGDTVYIFSDGYADQFGGPKGKKFMYKQLREVILSVQDRPMAEQCEILDEILVNWQGDEEQVDDILVIGVKI